MKRLRNIREIQVGMPPGSRSEVVLRAAFTLVEMLVSTALVVLIMMMFAQIYGSTIQTITLQRGIGNNDQKARSLHTIILSDLKSRTYRQATLPYGAARGIVPLAPGDEALVDPDRQKGYFYYSENDPANDTDDVLQFTTMIASSSSVGDESADSTKVYFGKAANLASTVNWPSANWNQPQLDDKYDDTNANVGSVGQSQSRAAEICYFLRGGNLYRRVLLLRDPPFGTNLVDFQPEYNDGTKIFGVPAGPTVRNYMPDNFYSVFDYSATRFFDDKATGTSYLWFNTVDSLNNGNESIDHIPIALPWNRFGHLNNPRTSSTIPDSIDHGCPREFEWSANPASQFIGRYTSEETSNSNMLWPGQDANSMDRSVNAAVNTSTYAVNNFSGGSRMAEDLLLTNVEAFNVEYYDDNQQAFVSLSTNASSGAVNSWSRNNNPNYGPFAYPGSGRINNVFDTWHPEAFTVTSAGMTSVSQPPLRPLVSMGTIYDSWADAPATVSVGDAIRVTPGNNSLVYRAIRGGTKVSTEPSFVPTIGNTFEETPGGVAWQCIDNRIGLKAIQITVRFRDPNKGLPKQVTLVHSFVE